MCTRCLLQATKFDASREDLWKDLGLVFYQQHKFIMLPTPPPPAPATTTTTDSTSTTTSAETSTPVTVAPADVPVVQDENDTEEKRKERLKTLYQRSEDYFKRAVALNPKECLYLISCNLWDYFLKVKISLHARKDQQEAQ